MATTAVDVCVETLEGSEYVIPDVLRVVFDQTLDFMRDKPGTSTFLLVNMSGGSLSVPWRTVKNVEEIKSEETEPGKITVTKLNRWSRCSA